MNETQQPTDTEPMPPRLSQLDDLQMTQMPQRDLWPGIEARVAPVVAPRRRWGGAGFAAAASVAVVTALGVWQMQDRTMPTPGPASAPLVAQTSAVQPEMRVAGMVQPQQAALLKANLAIVDDAEGQLRYALNQAPESEALQRLLRSVEQRRGALQNQLEQAI